MPGSHEVCPLDADTRGHRGASMIPFLRRVPLPVWVALLWAVATLPHLPTRSFIWEEGNNAELARDVLARGDWLEPAIFGLRYVEKPSLLAWLIAGTARLTGAVDEWSARLPSMLAVLGTALLVQRLVRPRAGARAALFAAGAFMFSPLLLRKLTVSEPDTLVTFLSFAAFVVWWDGEARGRVSLARWLACGGLLAAVALAKGPQPVGFFALGVGGYLAVRRHRTAWPGLALSLALPAAATVAWAAAIYRAGDAPAWLAYMRLYDPVTPSHYVHTWLRFVGELPIDFLPSTIVLPWVATAWRRRSPPGARPDPVLVPLVLYASLCTVALLWWPGAKTRYAMPIAPAVAVTAGLAVEPLWRRRHWAGAVAPAAALILFAYQVAAVTVAVPRFARDVGATRRLGLAIDAAVRAAPAPVFAMGAPQSNKLFYVTWPIRGLALPDASLPAPAWVLTPRSKLGLIEARRPDLVIREISAALPGPGLVLARIERRSGSAAAAPAGRPG